MSALGGGGRRGGGRGGQRGPSWGGPALTAAWCSDTGPGTTGSGSRSGMRAPWGLFQTWVLRMTEQVSPISWGKGMGLSWAPFRPGQDQRVSLAQEKHILQARSLPRGFPPTPPPPPALLGPKQHPWGGRHRGPLRPCLPHISVSPHLFHPPHSAPHLPTFSSFLFLVKDGNLHVALEKVDTNVRVRGEGGW